jgi:hypothetical protein
MNIAVVIPKLAKSADFLEPVNPNLATIAKSGPGLMIPNKFNKAKVSKWIIKCLSRAVPLDFYFSLEFAYGIGG